MVSRAERNTRPLRVFALDVTEMSFGNVDKIIRINTVEESKVPIGEIPAPTQYGVSATAKTQR